MQATDFNITKVLNNEIDALIEIAKSTFIAFFKEFNSHENLDDYVVQAFSKSKIASELANTNSEFYFAKHQNKIVGYLKVNFASAQTELHDSTSLEIERIYVTQDFIGKKVGQVLFNKALEIALSQQLRYIWLGVWEHNLRAIRFYEKQNFVKFDTHIFTLGTDLQTDYLMKLQL